MNITSKINPWTIDDGGVVFLRNDGIEVGIQYWPPEDSSVTTDQLERLEEMYNTMLESWPYEKGRIRFVTSHRPLRESEVIHMEYPDTITDPVQLALIRAERDANEERVLSGLYKSHNNYIILHIPDQRPGVERSERRLWSEDDRIEIMMQAEDQRDRIISLLDVAGIPAAPVMEEDAFGLMWSWYNMGYIADEVPPYDPELHLPPDVTLEQVRSDETLNIKTLRSQIIQSENLAPKNEYIRNGDALIVVSDMKDYGDKGFPGFADNVLAKFVNYTYWYVVDVVFGKEAQIKAAVERNTSAAVRAAEDTGKREDQVRAAKMEQETAMAYYQGGRWLRFGVNMTVVAHNEMEVRSVRNMIRNEWDAAGRHVMTPGTYTNWEQMMYRLAPYSGMNSDFIHSHQSGSAVQFLPYYGPWENVGGITLAIMENKFGTQQRITLPKGSEQAPHMAFLGTTRSGKSFTLQRLLMSFYMQSASLRIIDMKNDYEPLVRWLGGQFVPCFPGGLLPDGMPVRFNIFQAKDSLMTTEDIRDVLAFLKALINQPLDLVHSSLLQSAVYAYVEAHTNFQLNVFRGGTLAGFVEFLYTNSRIGNIDFAQNPELGRIAKTFATALQAYCTGVYGQMFNGESTVHLTNRVIVFDISGIGGDEALMGAVMTLIRTNVWNSAKKRKDRRSRVVFVSEETGITGRIPEVAAALEEMTMAGAAYNLMVVMVAQNMTSLDGLEGVMNNITRVIIGRMESQREMDIVQQLFQMNDDQVRAVMGLTRVNGQYNELYIRETKPDRGPQYGVIRYRPTDVEFALFDSSAEAKTQRSFIMDKYGDDQSKMLEEMIQFHRSRR